MLCDRCGRENPDGFRFCGACGAPLTVPATSGGEQERKVISAVFCDLVGFTSRAETMDPEDVHDLLRAYYAGVRNEFEAFGGTVAKFIGDAVFVLYGAPKAHEDDAERAVRAALAVIGAVAELNAAHPGLDLHVHIGITTGEALITFGPQPDESGGLAWGDILNTAARLEAAAPADAILVDDATYRATRHAIEYGLAEPIHAKGKAEPVPVWQPVAPLTRPGLALGEGAGRPLVSRRSELALLVGLLDGVRGNRTPQMVTITGEPGIGKSRVVFELFRRIEEMADLLTFRLGRSPPYPEGIAFWALGEIVKGQVGVLESDSAATAEEKLHHGVRALVPITAEASRIEGHLRPLVGLGDVAGVSGDRRGEAFAAWRHFLEALARQRPLVLVFEDVQWADDGLLDFIEHLAGWTRDVPMFIVATARPELLRRRPRWADRGFAATLALPPLSNDETRELVGALAGNAGMSEAMTDAVVNHAAGNPLYSVEFVRMAADRGLLGAATAARGSRPVETLSLPESLRGIIAARLDSVSADDKRLLHAGAVVGRVIWPGALAAITGRSRRKIDGRLRDLEKREFLLSAKRSSVQGEPEYRFRHVLIRDVAYNEIPRLRRGEIHRKTAEWLSSLSPDRAADRAEMLAHHYGRAYELARAAGGDAEPVAEPARRALRDAGDRALTLHAFPAAARYFRTALELWPADDAERPSLLFRLGKSVYYSETAGAEILAEARDALLDAGDRGTAAEAEVFLANLAYHEGLRHRAFEHLDRAVALVDDLGPTRSRAEVLVDLANYLSLARDDERTIAAAQEALEIARSLGLREIEATALYTIGISRGLSGDLGGREDLQQSIAIAEEIGSHLSAQCCGVLADLECNIGNLETGFQLQARARRHAQAFGHGGYVRWLEGELVGQRYFTGEWDESLRGADALIAEAEGGTPNFMEGYCRVMRGRIRLARDDHAGSRDDATRAVAFARSAEDAQLLYPALAFGARAEVMAGSLDAGVSLADELLALWRAKVDAFPTSSWAVDLAWTLDALGRGGEFVSTAERVRSPTRWLHALVAFCSGDFPGAADRFAEIGSRPDEALARLRAAKALLDARREPEARAELRRAGAFYSAVGATTYLSQAESLFGGRLATKAT